MIGIEKDGYIEGAIFTITPLLASAADWATFLSKPVGSTGPPVAGLRLAVEYKGYGVWRVRWHSHPPPCYIPVTFSTSSNILAVFLWLFPYMPWLAPCTAFFLPNLLPCVSRCGLCAGRAAAGRVHGGVCSLPRGRHDHGGKAVYTRHSGWPRHDCQRG